MSKEIRKTNVRDYTKPIMLNFKGKEGYRAYVEIVTTPPVKYDAKKAIEEAKDNLKKQGLIVQ